MRQSILVFQQDYYLFEMLTVLRNSLKTLTSPLSLSHSVCVCVCVRAHASRPSKLSENINYMFVYSDKQLSGFITQSIH